MPNECSPEPANKVVTVTKTINSEEGGVAEQRITVRKGVSRAALYLAHVGSLPQETLPSPEPSEKTILSSVYDFFVEGFANCGALYPSAYINIADHPPKTEVPPHEALTANERRMALSLVPNAAGGGGNPATNDLAMTSQAIPEARTLPDRELPDRDASYLFFAEKGLTDRGVADVVRPGRGLLESDILPSRETERPYQWNWLRSCWDGVLAIRAHIRRERDLRKATDALAELDDDALKVIRIHQGHGQIEHAVSNGHDC